MRVAFILPTSPVFFKRSMARSNVYARLGAETAVALVASHLVMGAYGLNRAPMGASADAFVVMSLMAVVGMVLGAVGAARGATLLGCAAVLVNCAVMFWPV